MIEKYLYVIVLLVSIIAGIFLNRFFLNRKPKFLVKKANNSAIRWSSQSKPIFGGITFYCLFILGMIAFLFLFGFEVVVSKAFLCLFIVVTLSFFMGFADDIINTNPFFKFIVQFLVAIIFIFSDIYIKISPIDAINYAITIVWVVGIMNSINMLDNMDAITSMASLSIIGSTVIYGLLNTGVHEPSLHLFISVVLTGALISFLYYNWNPAKMYMGDNGSQILGVFLAFVGISVFWNGIDVEEYSYAYNSKQALSVALAFIVPLSDTTTVTINRLLRKKSPFVGGRDHTTHHLSYLGIHERGIALILFSLNCIGLFLAYTVLSVEPWSTNQFWLYAIYPLLVFATLYSITKISKQKK